MSEKNGKVLYIPSGFAHGFCTLKKPATLVYNVTSVYKKDFDTGILWKSAGITWPNKKPLVSKRDKTFQTLDSFDSPFLLNV